MALAAMGVANVEWDANQGKLVFDLRDAFTVAIAAAREQGFGV